MEYAPRGGGGRMWMSNSERRKMRAKIIKGGKIADEIRKEEQKAHEEEEIPAAEKEMEEQMKQLEQEEKQQKKFKKNSEK
jgi:hypothetical protein